MHYKLGVVGFGKAPKALLHKIHWAIAFHFSGRRRELQKLFGAICARLRATVVVDLSLDKRVESGEVCKTLLVPATTRQSMTAEVKRRGYAFLQRHTMETPAASRPGYARTITTESWAGLTG